MKTYESLSELDKSFVDAYILFEKALDNYANAIGTPEEFRLKAKVDEITKFLQEHRSILDISEVRYIAEQHQRLI